MRENVGIDRVVKKSSESGFGFLDLKYEEWSMVSGSDIVKFEKALLMVYYSFSI